MVPSGRSCDVDDLENVDHVIAPGGGGRQVRPGGHLVANRDWRSRHRSETFLSCGSFEGRQAPTSHVRDEPGDPGL